MAHDATTDPAEPETPSETAESTEQLHVPVPDERQLTLRAVVVGCLLGGVVAAMNLYLGLKIGWSIGGSLMAAILAYGAFSMLAPALPYTLLEANITQTTCSAAGTMVPAAGLTATIPAMKLLDQDLSTAGLFAWTAAVAYLGVMFAVPLRRQYVIVEKLRFPTGMATANTVVAMFAKAGEAVAKAKVLLYFGVFAFAYITFAYFIPDLESPRMHVWFGGATLTTLATWGFTVYLGPMLVGVGLIIEIRISLSLLAGALVGWGLLGYTAQSQGFAVHPNPMEIQEGGLWGAAGWIMWPGVAIMVGDALVSLALSWRSFAAALRVTGRVATGRQTDDTTHDTAAGTIPNSWWLIGLALASLGTIAVTWTVFGIPPYLSVIAILLSAILSNVAVRATGETDINPVGPLGQVAQGAFGPLTDSMATNIMSAGITGAGASQAADMMQDFKTGSMLGASPRKQMIAQLWGIAAGILAVVPIYLLFDTAWDIGSEKLRAPHALTWKAVAEIMSKGFGAMPEYADVAMLVGVIFGALLPIVRRLWPDLAPYTPSGLAFGIAFLVLPSYSLSMAVGALALALWRQVNRAQCERFVFAVACGLIAGHGLAGLTQAVLKMLNVPTLVT